MLLDSTGINICTGSMTGLVLKNSSGTEAESERSKVAISRVVPPKPDPLAAPTALQPGCSTLENDLLPG